MKNICTRAAALFFFLCAFAFNSSAQKKLSLEETTFLKTLNALVSTTKQNHWAFDEPLKIDSAYHIIGDSISLTLKATGTQGNKRIRFTAPIRKMADVIYDLYLILEFEGDVVNTYEQVDNGPWTYIETGNYFYVGAVQSKNKKELKLKEDIEKAWTRLALKYGK